MRPAPRLPAPAPALPSLHPPGSTGSCLSPVWLWRRGAAVHLSPPPHPLRPPAQVKHDLAKLQLTSPVCTKEGEKIALSRRVDKHWRLIGWGQIQKGLTLTLT